jgi:hypothetical protein
MRSSRYRRRAGSAQVLAAVSILLNVSPTVTAENTRIATKHCLTNPPPPLRQDVQLGCPPPIDESIGPEPVDWSPWTHRPHCLEAERDPKIKYCVYSNSHQGKHGVSIITKPRTAALSAEMLNAELPRRHTDKDSQPGYEVIDMPGKGKGVVATRKISRAQVIMSDWAAVLLDMSFPRSVQQLNGHRLLHRAADQLSNPETVLQLGRSSIRASDIMEDIIGTNAFSYTLGDEPHMVLYPNVSVSLWRA